MPNLSLTDFVDFAVSNDPIAKINKLTKIKNRPDYEPAFDYWKPLRDNIIATHKNSLEKNSLDDVLLRVSSAKHANYRTKIDAYKTWWGRKSFTWFEPETCLFSENEVDIHVNPEAGLSFGGKNFLIKLYFKPEELTKRKSEIILLLMNLALSSRFPNATMAVLDIQNQKLFDKVTNTNNLQKALKGEISYIAATWNSL